MKYLYEYIKKLIEMNLIIQWYESYFRFLVFVTNGVEAPTY